MKQKLVLFFVFSVLLASLPFTINAQGFTNGNENEQETPRPSKISKRGEMDDSKWKDSRYRVDPIISRNPSNRPSERPLGRPSGKPTGQGNSCLAREAAIKTRSENLNTFNTRVLQNLDNSVIRVKEYYSKTMVPAGETVVNYDVLLQDIALKRTAVVAANTKAQAILLGFSCNVNSPKELISSFNTSMKEVKKALNLYKDSVKKLIVAVRGDDGRRNRLIKYTQKHNNLTPTLELQRGIKKGGRK